MVVFRENTEYVYAGLELKSGSSEVKRLIDYLRSEYKWEIRPDSAIGIKPISREGSRRLIRSAIDYAIRYNRRNITLVHKGNIQKFTEGAFRNWGYELAKEAFPHETVIWDGIMMQRQGIKGFLLRFHCRYLFPAGAHKAG
jgi:isocitrate dehydrogenase